MIGNIFAALLCDHLFNHPLQICHLEPVETPPPTSHRDRLPIMNSEMIAHLNEWLEQCDTLQSSHIITEVEIIEYVVKGKEELIEDKTADLAAGENEDEGI